MKIPPFIMYIKFLVIVWLLLPYSIVHIIGIGRIRTRMNFWCEKNIHGGRTSGLKKSLGLILYLLFPN